MAQLKILSHKTQRPVSIHRREPFMFAKDMVYYMSHAERVALAKSANICSDTLYRWLREEVTYPSTRTLFAVIQALGYETVIKIAKTK